MHITICSLMIGAALVFLSGTSVTLAAGTSTPLTSQSTSTPDQRSVEERVREYFVDIPVMIEIARCESKFRQFSDSGAVLYGGMGGGMIGVFQFYEKIHAKAAQGLGFDLATVDGNLGYARHVYTQSGTTPWNSAADCWKSVVTKVSTNKVVKATSIEGSKNHQEQIILLKQVIALLQQMLALQLALQSSH